MDEEVLTLTSAALRARSEPAVLMIIWIRTIVWLTVYATCESFDIKDAAYVGTVLRLASTISGWRRHRHRHVVQTIRSLCVLGTMSGTGYINKKIVGFVSCTAKNMFCTEVRNKLDSQWRLTIDIMTHHLKSVLEFLS